MKTQVCIEVQVDDTFEPGKMKPLLFTCLVTVEQLNIFLAFFEILTASLGETQFHSRPIMRLVPDLTYDCMAK